jgi:hypothetical protein
VSRYYNSYHIQHSEHTFRTALMSPKLFLQEKHISLFDKMAALPTGHSWWVLEFGRCNSVFEVQCALQQPFGCRGPPVSPNRRWYEQFHDRGKEECTKHASSGNSTIHVHFQIATFYFHHNNRFLRFTHLYTVSAALSG